MGEYFRSLLHISEKVNRLRLDTMFKVIRAMNKGKTTVLDPAKYRANALKIVIA
jgi:hypothetical protein